ncbi:hypothetical protein EJ08DRAFT_303879 [Tothia fuscella]|uniref:Uncharacterized protein n=1 Tax=Tothia fuscella TaxID=1048955 RepID=A0A9P4NPU1_9PEZI|nr:hypothetical protein EJ08DRAFT_303879 [Tothia fuscella]
MFAKSTILALVSSTLIAAAPQAPRFPFAGAHTNGTHVHPAPEECVTSLSTSLYTLTTTIPHIDSTTYYKNTTTVIAAVATRTALYTATTVITTSTSTCITTSYPVTSWVTKIIDTVAPVLVTESCTETTTYTEPTSKTVVTALPVLSSCTEYLTSAITGTSTIPITTCTPCTAGGAPAVTPWARR